jgi:hypothetical protein
MVYQGLASDKILSNNFHNIIHALMLECSTRFKISLVPPVVTYNTFTHAQPTIPTTHAVNCMYNKQAQHKQPHTGQVPTGAHA